MRKKKCFLMLLLLQILSVFCGMAQTPYLQKHAGGKLQYIPHKIHIEPQSGQAWWGYFADDGQYGDLGTASADTYHLAIYIPGDHEVAKTSKIYAERLWLSRNANIEDMKIWLSTALPDSAEAANICCKSVAFTKGGIVDYAFDEPYQIDDKGVYVGYTFTINKMESDDDSWPVYTTTGLDMVQNALFVKTKNVLGKWYSNFGLTNEVGGNWGNLAMQVLLGDGFFSNAASITDVGAGVVAVGGTTSVPVTIENLGGTDISSFSYTVTNNGVESEPIDYDASENPILGIFSSNKYNIPIVGGSETGESQAMVKIVSVNGESNELADGREQSTANIITVAKPSNRKTVMENFLEITDSYSPLVVLSNDRLGRNWHNEMVNPTECHVNHDNYIGIMIHDRDVMESSLYMKTLVQLDELQTQTQSPWIWCFVDRENRMFQYFGSQYDDPYNRRTRFGIEDDFLASQQKTVEAEVHITSDWADKDSTTVKTIVNTTFQYDAEKANYALAFILVEDGVHGEGSEWNLCNNILPQTKQGQVFYWDTAVWNNYVCGGKSISGVKYDDVVVAGDEIYNGISGSIKSPIKLGQEQHYIHKLDLSYNTSIQNKANLKMIVLLLDTRTGRIVNADRVHVGELADGIGEIEATDNTSAIAYDLQGRRIGNGYKGIVIKDGKKYIAK